MLRVTIMNQTKKDVETKQKPKKIKREGRKKNVTI